MVSLVLVQRRLQNLTVGKVVLALVVVVTFFNEYLVYTLHSFRWASIPTDRNPKEEMVILLVSDPQLIGIQDEIGFPLGPIIRWDADSYLRKTFYRAYYHTIPDVVVFLGDIMDEGSKATDSEYQSYFQRFNSIFYETSYAKTVVIPGDNDIGGEGGDLRTFFKVNRFEKHFENLTGAVSHGFVDFLKLDIRMMKDQVLEKQKVISDVATQLKGKFRIIVNHESIITKPKSSIYPSQMLSCDTCLSDDEDMNNWPYYQRDMASMEPYIDVDFTNLIALSEIMVPTCSYRMGVPKMGYGVAVINKSGKMKYTVLWLPSRYHLLYVYIVVLAVAAFVLIINWVFSPVKSRKWPYR
ncbi:unnamed protein product [Candidula unifasciata]|uniref:Calcineurin-like phosphoesterase domain-containing protein n=1 Tax=Candidula unifasciata TaxID=100452 RepID=A0A8S3ZPJ8_9EUPU|nr:unnamed protein product [Candidula unifasciata]